jgi:hypothetical protein
MPEAETVEMLLPDGTTILVEGWDMAAERGGVRPTAARDTAAAAAEAAESLRRTIRGYAELVISALREASEAAMPDKATISFGVKVGSGFSVAVARASGEANVTVTAEWTLRPSAAKT